VNNKIILALDSNNLEEVIDITKKIKDKVFTVKIGLEFFNSFGKEGIKKINKLGMTNLLLDLKLKDIPQTVYKAIKVLNDIEFGFITIHGQGGKKMLEKAVQACNEIHAKPRIMMVTILTALNENDLKIMGNNNSVIQQVESLSKMAKDANVGIICSGQEAKVVRKILGSTLPIFTPGIRMSEDNNNDQQRVCTPSESIKNGADKVIMGRSLIKGNIEDNIDKVSNSIKD
tara:strand:- start:453 stop:1142 length:690 start_codon:yes stop_codon:yes gene_type:complete